MSEARELMSEAAAAVTTAVHRAGDADLDGQTPCTEFALRDLVDHYLGTTTMLAQVAPGAATAGDGAPDRPTGPEAGNAADEDRPWPDRVGASLDRLARIWSEPSAWEGTVSMGSNELPATMIGDMVFAEILLHGWDVTRAAGVDLSVSPAVAAELRRGVEETAELGRQGKAYGEAVELPEGASDFDRALAASGRDPAWRR
jgi:uncharacterized protein (TIGR03086 family)